MDDMEINLVALLYVNRASTLQVNIKCYLFASRFMLLFLKIGSMVRMQQVICGMGACQKFELCN